MHRETKTLASNQAVANNATVDLTFPDTSDVSRMVVYVEINGINTVNPTGLCSANVYEVEVDGSTNSVASKTSLGSAHATYETVVSPLNAQNYLLEVVANAYVGSSALLTASVMYEYDD